MIIFIYGTTAEAIKIAPVARRLSEKGIRYQQWVTNQHAHELTEVLDGLGLNKPDHIIVDGIDGQPVKTVPDTLRWMTQIFGWVVRNRSILKRELSEDSVIVVHGDTVTTVIGTLIAKSLGLPTAHIEAGLRSGSIRHPFPEELDRIIVDRLANIHYTPSLEATRHLQNRKNVVFTYGNTAIDAVLDHEIKDDDPEQRYGVMLLHRFEFLTDENLVLKTINAISETAEIPIYFFADEHGQALFAKAMQQGVEGNIKLQAKLPHDEFTGLLRNADFVVTDSGGIQAECALLGVPTLIHRKSTEQDEGVGENLILSRWDIDTLRNFLKDYTRFRRPAMEPEFSPSELIIKDLTARGFIPELVENE